MKTAGMFLRTAVRVAACLTLLVVSTGCSKASESAGNGAGNGAAGANKLNRPLRVGIVTWGGYAGGIFANNGFKENKDSMFFKDFGITVELKVIDDFAASRAAFKAGGERKGVDVLWTTVDAFALEYPALKTLNPVAFLQYDWSHGGDAIAVAPGINELGDLKGKKVTVAEDTPSHFFALFALKQAGLTPKDVEFVFVGASPDAAQVFKAGKADAVVAWSPDPENAVKARPGSKVLLSTRTASRLIADIFIARQDFIEKYSGTMRAFTAGWLKGVDAAHENPTKAVDLMAANFNGITKEDAKAMYDNVQLPTYRENRDFFEVDKTSKFGYDKLFKIATDTWSAIGKLKTKQSPTDTRYNGLIRDVGREQDWGTEEPTEVAEVNDEAAKVVATERFQIEFPTGSWEIPRTKDNLAIIDKIAQKAQAMAGAIVEVSGHTDNVGDPWKNRWLSLRRAIGMVEILVKDHGLPLKRFRYKGYGPSVPLPPEQLVGLSKPERDAKLRRTEVRILGAE